jgi:DNA-binding NtrC family response regulator
MSGSLETMAETLVIDDEELVRRSLARILSGTGHNYDLVASVTGARQSLEKQGCDLAL